MLFFQSKPSSWGQKANRRVVLWKLSDITDWWWGGEGGGGCSIFSSSQLVRSYKWRLCGWVINRLLTFLLVGER
jgi:hypothetical protein